MRRLTPEELLDMQTDPWYEENRKFAESYPRLLKRVDELCYQIREAFKGVKLGGGVGLFEGRAMDDYEPREEQLKAREKDEKNDWSAIPIHRLNQYHSSLSFFDAVGFRFHLPAYMIAELNNELTFNFDFSLINFDNLGHRRYLSLNKPQRRTVRDYLLFLLEDIDYMFSCEEIQEALDTYWTEESCETRPRL